jgi:hypothetical protein
MQIYWSQIQIKNGTVSDQKQKELNKNTLSWTDNKILSELESDLTIIQAKTQA